MIIDTSYKTMVFGFLITLLFLSYSSFAKEIPLWQIDTKTIIEIDYPIENARIDGDYFVVWDDCTNGINEVTGTCENIDINGYDLKNKKKIQLVNSIKNEIKPLIFNGRVVYQKYDTRSDSTELWLYNTATKDNIRLTCYQGQKGRIVLENDILAFEEKGYGLFWTDVSKALNCTDTESTFSYQKNFNKIPNGEGDIEIFDNYIVYQSPRGWSYYDYVINKTMYVQIKPVGIKNNEILFLENNVFKKYDIEKDITYNVNLTVSGQVGLYRTSYQHGLLLFQVVANQERKVYLFDMNTSLKYDITKNVEDWSIFDFDQNNILVIKPIERGSGLVKKYYQIDVISLSKYFAEENDVNKMLVGELEIPANIRLVYTPTTTTTTTVRQTTTTTIKISTTTQKENGSSSNILSGILVWVFIAILIFAYSKSKSDHKKVEEEEDDERTTEKLREEAIKQRKMIETAIELVRSDKEKAQKKLNLETSNKGNRRIKATKKHITDNKKQLPKGIMEFEGNKLSERKASRLNKVKLDLETDFTLIRPQKFEQMIESLFRKMGYKVDPLPATGDHGIDLIAEMEGDKIAVQVKHRRDLSGPRIGSEIVQRTMTMGNQKYGADHYIIVTNHEFTADARDTADTERGTVELWDGRKLKEKIRKYFIDEELKK